MAGTRGRPTTFSQEIADEICRRIADGEALKAICRDEHMPAPATVRGWAIDDREGFYAPYTRATEIRAHGLVEEIFDIADDGTNDTQEDADGNVRVDHDIIARSRLRVDTRKWFASKVLPKLYGDRTTIAGDADNPIHTKDVSNQDRLAALAAMIAKASK